MSVPLLSNVVQKTTRGLSLFLPRREEVGGGIVVGTSPVELDPVGPYFSTSNNLFPCSRTEGFFHSKLVEGPELN